MKPKISIIIPAWNAASSIEETIQSVLQQTVQDWELIVIDDGSTDSTAEKVNSFSEHARIKLFTQKNAGVAAARNSGIEKSSGEFISFLDADDKWLPDNLEKKLLALEQHPEVGFSYSQMFRLDTKLELSEKAKPGNLLERLLLWEEEVIPTPCSNILIRRKFIDDGLKFDSHFSTAADQDFIFHLTKLTTGILVDEPLLIYRNLPASMSKNIFLLEKDHMAVYKKASRDHLFRSWIFENKCFANLYLILAGNWWVNGRKKMRSAFFILIAIVRYPPIIGKLVKKLFSKK